MNRVFQSIGRTLLLGWQTLCHSNHLWKQRRKIAEQLFEIGNGSLLMACVLSLFIGGVLALQSGPVLVERGLASVIGQIVGLSMCKELAPVMMSILIAGRIGSAMAAEIGSMRVYQEIDALKTMNINPLTYLVLPRIVAIAIALPMLVIFSILVGWMGGALVSSLNHQIAVPITLYFSNLKEAVDLGDIFNGISKSLVFALSIGLISCRQGLDTEGGPRGIGHSVTKAVVYSTIFILILDYFLTRLLLYID